MRSYPRSTGESLNSRLATVVALVHDGTWYIDRPLTETPNPFEQITIDKVNVSGRLISSKPPMLSLLMATEYLLLDRVIGLDLLNPKDLRTIAYSMTLSFVGLPYILFLVCLWKTLRLYMPADGVCLPYLFAAAFCTPVSGYAAVFNSHVAAAGLLAASIYFASVTLRNPGESYLWIAFLAGLAAGFVPTIDMPAGIFVALGGAYWVVNMHSRAAAVAAIGFAIPVVIHLALMIHITGSPLPVQVRESTFLYEASYWRNPIGMDALANPRPTYLFHMTLGKKGLFLLYPVLALGVWRSLRCVLNSESPRRSVHVLGLLGFASLTGFYVFKTTSYGGEAFGFRWYIIAVPVLILMAASTGTARAGWAGRVAWGLVASLSLFSAWQCSLNPWQAGREWTMSLLGPGL